MIEGSGVHPEPIDRPSPRAVDCRLQQKRAEPPPDELRDQPEIGQLGLARISRIELEVAGRNAADIQNENLGGVLGDLGSQGLVVEQPSLVPQPRRPDRLIEVAVERDGAVLRPDQGQLGVWRRYAR